MDVLVWFGMILMMFFILIFMYTLISHLISTNTSQQSFDAIMSMASSACSSFQSSSSITFSNPASEVIQIYDDPTCNSTLYSNPSWFNPEYPYNSTMNSLVNNYDLCYVQLTKYGASQTQLFGQAYTSQRSLTLTLSSTYPSAPPYSIQVTFSYPVNFGNFVNSYFIFSTSGSLNVSATGGEIQFINSSGQVCGDVSFTQSNSSSFSVNEPINFSQNCKSAVENSESGYINLTVNEESGAGPFKVISAPSELTSSQPSYIFAQTQLAYNCNAFSGFDAGTSGSASFSKGTLICAPITCNGNNFLLTDSNNNILNTIVDSSFTFFELSPSSVGAIEITNPNTESLASTYPVS